MLACKIHFLKYIFRNTLGDTLKNSQFKNIFSSSNDILLNNFPSWKAPLHPQWEGKPQQNGWFAKYILQIHYGRKNFLKIYFKIIFSFGKTPLFYERRSDGMAGRCRFRSPIEMLSIYISWTISCVLVTNLPICTVFMSLLFLWVWWHFCGKIWIQ